MYQHVYFKKKRITLKSTNQTTIKMLPLVENKDFTTTEKKINFEKIIEKKIQ